MTRSKMWSGGTLTAKLLLAYARIVPNHPAKLRIFRILARRLYPLGIPLRTEGGVRIAIDPGDFIGHSLCFGGCYEPLSLQLAQRLMMTGGTFVDVGANVGLYTCSISAIPNVLCIAIEVSPEAASRLRQNVKRNKTGQVRIANLAVGAERSLQELNDPKPDNLGTSNLGNPRDAGGTVVSCLPLEELLPAMRVTSVRLLKIDVEGYESKVLRGLNLEGALRPQHIITEYSQRIPGNEIPLQELFSVLTRSNYIPRNVLGEPFSPSRTLPEENIWWSSGTGS